MKGEKPLFAWIVTAIMCLAAPSANAQVNLPRELNTGDRPSADFLIERTLQIKTQEEITLSNISDGEIAILKLRSKSLAGNKCLFDLYIYDPTVYTNNMRKIELERTKFSLTEGGGFGGSAGARGVSVGASFSSSSRFQRLHITRLFKYGIHLQEASGPHCDIYFAREQTSQYEEEWEKSRLRVSYLPLVCFSSSYRDRKKPYYLNPECYPDPPLQ